MSKLKCIIIEDEPLAVKILSDYIAQVPFLDLQASFKDAILALQYLQHEQPDLIFLDIHLPKLKGINFLKSLPHPPAVIMTTAYHQYAVEGFNLNVVDYLLKPFEFDRFLIAVNKVRLSPHKLISTRTEEDKNYFFVNVQKKKVKIHFGDILYVESQREYVRIVTIKKEYLCKMPTHEIEQLLPADQFIRIHRSFIIALPKIDSFTHEEIEINGVIIPIGRGYKDVVQKFL